LHTSFPAQELSSPHSRTQELSSLPPVLATPGAQRRASRIHLVRRRTMNGVIYIIGLIVVIMFILSFLGLR
jgi:hypothetical protein